MSFAVSPGVTFVENDYTGIVPGVSTYIGGFVGSFRWGPVEQITTVSNETDLCSRFWTPDESNFKYWFQAAGYLSYSTNLNIVRVVGADAANAYSGCQGDGLQLAVTVFNGSVITAVVAQGGTGYALGDLVKISGSGENAIFRVVGVDPLLGAATVVNIISGGSALSAGTKSTSPITTFLVKNDDVDLSLGQYPEVIGRYPGSLAGDIRFDIVRASEFEGWAFKDRFVVSPSATVWKWSSDGISNTYSISAYGNTLPADAVVTVDSKIVSLGAGAGQYSFSGTTLTIHGDSQTFTGVAGVNSWVLTNASSVTTSTASMTVAGIAVTRYDGTGTTPAGQFSVSGNTVKYGVGSAAFSGDAFTGTFTISGKYDITDAVVKVNGVSKIVDSTGSAPNAGHVIVKNAASGTDSLLIFNSGEIPSSGTGNVAVTWGFPTVGAPIIVSYGSPKKGTNNVKIFSNQTEAHGVVVDAVGNIGGAADTILERYEYMTLSEAKYADGTSSYYPKVINRKSKWIRLPSTVWSFGQKLLNGGVDSNEPDADITPGILQTGYALFQNGDAVDVNHIIGGDADVATAEMIIGDVAEYRRDVVAYFSPPMAAVVDNKGFEADAVIDFRNSLPSTSYAHLSSGWAWRYDRYNDTYRWIPLAGDDAGLYALTHQTNDPWWSSGGFTRGRYQNVVKLAWSPNKTERDKLYPNGINPSTWFKGEGAILYGDKTLQTKASAFDRMNVRWLFITLEKSISKAAKYFLFEFNDAFTRNQFKNMVHPFLRDVQGRRGITDFKIICDDTNNTGSVIDRNEFIGDIYIKPARSINFIVLNFNAVATSVSFDEIVQSSTTTSS